MGILYIDLYPDNMKIALSQKDVYTMTIIPDLMCNFLGYCTFIFLLCPTLVMLGLCSLAVALPQVFFLWSLPFSADLMVMFSPSPELPVIWFGSCMP